MTHSIRKPLLQALFGLLSFFLFYFFPTQLSAQICNRIEFHDFEEANYQQGWLSSDGVNPLPSGLGRTDSAVISGNYAAQLKVLGDGATMHNRTRRFALQSGKYYSLSFWARSSDSSSMRFGIVQDSSFNFVLLDSSQIGPNWQEVTAEFQAPADWNNAVLIISPLFDPARGPYDFFLDFVTLCEREESNACNLSVLPSFESLAYINNWSHFDGGEAASSFLLLSEDAYDKRYSAELRINYFGGSGAFITTATRSMFPVDSGDYYTLDFWMKSDVDSARIEALVNRRTPYRELGTQFFIMDTVWRKYSLSFQSDVTANQAYIRFIAKNAYLTQPYSIFIDDIRLCKSDEPPQIAPGAVSRGLVFWAKANEGPNARTVSSWEDMSANENHLLRTQTAPQRRLEIVNLNEGVRFNSMNDRLVSAPLDIANRAANHTWYVVLKGNNPAVAAVPFAFFEEGYRLEIDPSNQWSVQGIQPAQSMNIPGDVNAWSMLSAISNGTNYRVFLNGIRRALLNPLTGLELGDSTLMGAKNLSNEDWWNGDIAEVIVYRNSQGNAERFAVTTYLSLKYGLSIPVNQHLYYTYTGFGNNIAGIGQDLAGMALKQTKSRSSGEGSIVSISRPSRLDDGDFMVWGHNNGGLNTSSQVPTAAVSRLNRTWRVSHRGNLGKVSLAFDLEEIGWTPGYAYGLLIDKDGNFSNAELISKAYLNDHEVGFSGVSLEEGDYFTLAILPNAELPKAPGGIDDGLVLWLQAEEGPNSNSLSYWEDLSPHANSATAFDEGPRRELDQINGNPAIDFSNSRNLMIGSSELYLRPEAHSYYIVLNAGPTRNWTNALTLKENGYRLEVNGNTRNFAVYGIEPGGMNSTAPSARWSMMAATSSADGYSIFENGVENLNRSVRDGLVGDGPYFIGARNRNFSSWYTGQVAEVIIYGKEQSPAERQAIETYLNIKYALPIPVSSHLFYNQTSHTQAIAGIGRDIDQRLWQDNSKSMDSSALLRISNPSGLGEGEYLVWAHDGSNLERNANVPSAVNMRVNRSWRVSRTGNPGRVWVEFELAGLGLDLSDASEFALLIDSDKDFSDAQVFNNGALVGSKIQFKGIQFNDGDLFSLAIADMATSVNQDLPSELLSWEIYPNPGTDLFQINWQTAYPTELDLEIFDGQGRIIYQENLQSFGAKQNQRIETDHWPKGIYFVRLREGNAAVAKTWLRR
ncbi:MAG: LamG-like jellyroll fold domain-containing protein [Bacteroidota bacterium]